MIEKRFVLDTAGGVTMAPTNPQVDGRTWIWLGEQSEDHGHKLTWSVKTKISFSTDGS